MIHLILLLAMAGLIVYLILTYIPMPQLFKTVILVVAAILLILYLMQILGVGDIPIPRIR